MSSYKMEVPECIQTCKEREVSWEGAVLAVCRQALEAAGSRSMERAGSGLALVGSGGAAERLGERSGTGRGRIRRKAARAGLLSNPRESSVGGRMVGAGILGKISRRGNRVSGGLRWLGR